MCRTRAATPFLTSCVGPRALNTSDEGSADATVLAKSFTDDAIASVKSSNSETLPSSRTWTYLLVAGMTFTCGGPFCV